MLDHTWVITPAVVLDHHFVYAHQESNRIPNTLGFNPTSIGFNGNVTAGLQTTTFPTISSASRLSGLGPLSGNESDGGTTYEYAASLSWLKGKHAFKFGFDYRSLAQDLNVNQLVSVAGNSNFTGGPKAQSAIADSGSGIADILLGTGTVTSGIVPGYHTEHPYYAGYALDEYHVTTKLTLTYGIRYSIEMPDGEAHNKFQYIDLTSASPLSGETSLGTLTGGPGFVGASGGTRISTTQYNNFDPRVGFAYSLNDKTVIRGGVGLFHAPTFIWLSPIPSQGYSEPTTSIAAQPNGVTPLYNMDNPFPTGLIPITGNSLGLLTNAGLAISGFPRKQINAYSDQWSVDVQRQLPHNFVVTLGYVGNEGVHLYTPYNNNQLPDSALAQGMGLLAPVTNPFYGVITTATSPLAASKVAAWQLQRPHPQFLNMTSAFDSAGHSSYNAMQLSLEHRFSQGLSVLADYTYSRMFDNVMDYYGFIYGNSFTDNNCPRCDRSISSQDMKHVMRISGQYELPFGRNKAFLQSGIAAQILGGWSLGTVFTFDSGVPVQATEGNLTYSYAGGGSSMRPNVVPGVSTNVPGGRHIRVGVPAGTLSEYFNPAAFSQAAAFTYGNARRFIDSIRIPGTDNFDMHVEKAMPIYEEMSLKFRVEFFNAFNRVQFAGPTGAAGANTPNESYIGAYTGPISSSFGMISPTQANNPRELQGSLRLSF
jgi:hypothetical protein